MFSSSSKASSPFTQIKWNLSWSIWLLVGFFIAQSLMVFAWEGIVSVLHITTPLQNSPILQLSLSALVYVLALVVVVGTPQALGVIKSERWKKQLGILRRPILNDSWRAVLGYGAYFLLTVIAALSIQAVWSDFPIDEAQQVGFGGLETTTHYIMAFVALVIIPPIAEEMLFRGYLFGKLRQKSGLIVSTLVTSFIFGLVHLQLNVGVDVFMLSLVLCCLREFTGNIWAGVFLHMIKNAIAFTFLFLSPEILQSLF